jgi:hypothetical protein
VRIATNELWKILASGLAHSSHLPALTTRRKLVGINLKV